MTIHADLLTVAMASVILTAGFVLAVGLIWTVRHRSAPTDLSAIAMREACSRRLSGSARAASRTDAESETS